MSTANKMLESHPHPLGQIDRVKLTAAIDACADCNQACTACAREEGARQEEVILRISRGCCRGRFLGELRTAL